MTPSVWTISGVIGAYALFKTHNSFNNLAINFDWLPLGLNKWIIIGWKRNYDKNIKWMTPFLFLLQDSQCCSQQFTASKKIQLIFSCSDFPSRGFLGNPEHFPLGVFVITPLTPWGFQPTLRSKIKELFVKFSQGKIWKNALKMRRLVSAF